MMTPALQYSAPSGMH